MPNSDLRRLAWTSAAAALTIGTLSMAQLAPASELTASSPTSQPATRAVDEYERLLGDENDAAERPLLPTNRTTIDRTTGNAAVAPNAARLPTKQEGTFIIDRVGRLSRAGEGGGWEFIFLADSDAMQDPPVKVLPNQKLQVMEDELQAAGRPLKFRISGTLTEYRGRNYVMLEKVIVVKNPS